MDVGIGIIDIVMKIHAVGDMARKETHVLPILLFKTKKSPYIDKIKPVFCRIIVNTRESFGFTRLFQIAIMTIGRTWRLTSSSSIDLFT